MPTAAKLFAAVGFALVAWVAADLFRPAMPQGTQFGYFLPLTAALGLLCGWLVMGPLAGRGYVNSMGYGVRTSVTIAFWALLLFSIHEMILRSNKLRYDGPMEAITAVFGLMLERGALMLSVEVMGALLLGGMLGGILAEWASRRWK